MNPDVAHKFKPIDRNILSELADGRNVPSNIAETLDVSRQWITQRLQQMESAGYVHNIDRGVYELVPEELPEDERAKLDLGEESVDELRTERDTLQNRLGECLEDLEDCREQLDADGDADIEEVRKGLKTAKNALEGRPPSTDQAINEIERALEELNDA